MPLVTGGSNPNAPTMEPPSFAGSLAQQAQSVAAGYGNAIANPAQQWGFIKSKPQAVGDIGSPWNPFTSEAEASVLKVYGKALPVGAVLTHCTVSELVEYREHPLSDVTPVSLKLNLSASLRADKFGVVASAIDVKLARDRYAAVPAAIDALTGATVDVKGTKGHVVTLEEAQALVSVEQAAFLTLGGAQVAAQKLTQRVNKVYIGERRPRQAELRLILQDVIEPVLSAGFRVPDHRVASRYELLKIVRELFCDNPFGVDAYRPTTFIMAAASRISNEVVNGHIVNLSSKGLDPYPVERWLTVGFHHVEVPDSDVIAVKISLVEYESLEHTGSPLDPAITTCPDVAPVAPVAPVRPSYLVDSGLESGVTP